MAATKYLDYNGLLYFWTLIKGMFAKPSNADPQMDGTASAGSSALYARGDHVHPSDTSKASKSSTTSAGSYGQSSSSSPGYGGTFKVPYVTVNADGIVTGVTESTVTLPSGDNTDQKVKQNLTGTTDTKKYPLLLKYTNTATDSPTQESRYVAAVTLQPSTGTVEATKFKGAMEGNADTATALATARSINVQDADGTNTGTAASFDGTANATVKLPSTIKASLTGNASSADKVNHDLVIKIKTGTSENTSLYTYNGSAAKTLDIKQGSNVTLTAAANSLTIAATNTKNTAGSTDSSSKLYLVGATEQSVNPQTYSQDTAFVGADGHLYSNSKKVFTADDAYTKSEIDTKLTGGMHYKGSVQTVADLPASGNEIGDFYNVIATGENYAWDGSAWDQTGSMVDLQPITNAEIDTIVAS